MHQCVSPVGLRPRGFTLIELLVVIAIIGILSSIVIGGLSTARQSGNDARRIADVKNIQVALALYYLDNNHYPCAIYANPAGAGCSPSFFQSSYMSQTPLDPQGNSYYYSAYALDSSGGGTTNCVSANNTVVRYHLGAVLEVSSNGQLAQDAAWPPASPYASACNVVVGQSNSNTNFTGDSTGCITTAGPDTCYDVLDN